MKLRIIFLFFLCVPLWLFSQQKVWTLDECISYAVQNNPKRVEQEAQNEIYRLNRQDAIGNFLPSLNAGTGVSLNIGRGLNPETNTYINQNTVSNSYEVSSSMTIFSSFSRINKAKIAKLNRLKGTDQLQETKDLIAIETMELFFNVLYYQGTVELSGKQLAESAANAKRVKRMEELGLKSIPDVAEIESKEAEDQYLLVRQQNLLNQEIIRLKEKMNFPVDENLIIENSYDNFLITKSEEKASDIYRQALMLNPEILASQKSLKSTELNRKIAYSYGLPTVSFNGNYSTGFSKMLNNTDYQGFEEQLKNRQGYYFSISLNVPIFNRFSNLNEVRRSKQQLIIAESQHEELLRQVYSEIEQAVADMNGLVDEYHHALKRTEAAKKAHEVNLRKYDEGLINAIEVTTSANRLLQAQVEELYIRLKYQVKVRVVDYYKGTPLSAGL